MGTWAGSAFKGKDKEASGPKKLDDANTKNGGKANKGNRIIKASCKPKIKRGKEKETQRSLRDLWLTTARERGRVSERLCIAGVNVDWREKTMNGGE